jgi:putative DNA primase/helicase
VSDAATIGRSLGAVRQGHNWRVPCILGCNYSLSLADGDDGRLLVHCFGGCKYADILLALIAYGLGAEDSVEPCEASARRRSVEDEKRLIDSARWLYQQAVEAPEIGVYTRSRGIAISSPVLRFCHNTPHRLGGRFPAMLAPIVNVEGEQTGAHATFLQPGGIGKAKFPSRDHQRECRGMIGGGAIRLAPHDPGRALIVGEGIESTLSAMQVFGLPGWSATSAGGLRTIKLPPVVRHIVVTVDNDMNRCGQSNALVAYERWTAEGRMVRIKSPPVEGDDFNDVLIKRCAK